MKNINKQFKYDNYVKEAAIYLSKLEFNFKENSDFNYEDMLKSAHDNYKKKIDSLEGNYDFRIFLVHVESEMQKKLEREKAILINMHNLMHLLIDDMNENYTTDYDNFCCNLSDMFEEYSRFYNMKGHGGVFREIRRVE